MSDRKPKRRDQPEVSTKGLVVISALGMVLTMCGLATSYYENARFKAQHGIWALEGQSPRYPGFILLAGLFLISFVVLTAGSRLVRGLYHRIRLSRGKSDEQSDE